MSASLKSALLTLLSSVTLTTERELVEAADVFVDEYLELITRIRALTPDDLDSSESIMLFQDYYASEIMVAGGHHQGIPATVQKYQELRTNPVARMIMYQFVITQHNNTHADVAAFRAKRAADPEFKAAMAAG